MRSVTSPHTCSLLLLDKAMYLHKSPCRYKKKITVVLKIRTHFLVFTCWEKRPAGAARAPETVQMLRMASRTDTRPDLGASGFTIACNIKNFVHCIQWGINNWELAGDTQLFSFQKMFSFLEKRGGVCSLRRVVV